MPIFNSSGMNDKELLARSRSSVTVLRQLSSQECDDECQPMYRVRFADGFETDAFADELDGSLVPTT